MEGEGAREGGEQGAERTSRRRTGGEEQKGTKEEWRRKGEGEEGKRGGEGNGEGERGSGTREGRRGKRRVIRQRTRLEYYYHIFLIYIINLLIVKP